MPYRLSRLFVSLLTFSLLVTGADCHALEISDQFSISGVLAGAYQYQDGGDGDTGRGGVPIQLELAYSPDPQNTFSAKFGLASGNGLNGAGSFSLAPWAADLEDDVRDINGSGRDYLLTAWYMHTFEFTSAGSLSVAGGIIDATDYLDENGYANDEYTQFMNEALVNGPNAFLPSYDVGGAVRWEKAGLAAATVFMHINENENGNSYNFVGLQLGYTAHTTLGSGNYRLILGSTSSEFTAAAGSDAESLKCVLLSLDQQLGPYFGVWLRLGTQDDGAVISYKNIYSGGLNVNGSLWGRENDNMGVGYAFLEGGNSDLDTSQALEAYIRFGLNDYLAFTMDIQYMNDKYNSTETTEGFLYGLRAAAEF